MLLNLGFFLLLAPMTTPCGTCCWKLQGMGGASASKEEATARTSTHKVLPVQPVSLWHLLTTAWAGSLAPLRRWALPYLQEAGLQLWPPVLLKVVCVKSRQGHWVQRLEMGCSCLCLPQVPCRLSFLWIPCCRHEAYGQQYPGQGPPTGQPPYGGHQPGLYPQQPVSWPVGVGLFSHYLSYEDLGSTNRSHTLESSQGGLARKFKLKIDM